MAGPQVAVCRATGAAHGILVWHDCPPDGGWVASGAGLHTVLGNEISTMTFQPSLYFLDCCGLHGWIENGVWKGV